MIPGPLDDDKYRMVEDEFLSIAQLFTNHLHRAEYNRLETLAKSHNAATIRSLERPVVDSQTKVAKRRAKEINRVTKQRRLLGDKYDVELPWIGTSLQGLMESPSKAAKMIRPFPTNKTGTRAAAGFGLQTSTSAVSSPALKVGQNSVSGNANRRVSVWDNDSDETDDDDLGAVSANTASTKVRSLPSVRPKSPLASKSSSASKVMSRWTETKILTATQELESEDDDPFGINKRIMQRQKSRKSLWKPTKKPSQQPSPDIIPTFL